MVNTRELGQVDEAGVARLKRYTLTNTQAMTAEQFQAEILNQVATLPR